MSNTIRLMIADDYPLFKEGLHLLLRHYPQLVIVGEADNGETLLSLIQKDQPDVVITDIQMPVLNGIELTKIIRKDYPDTKVIALTMYEDEHLITDMLEAGATGYLRKNTSKEELVDAIEVVNAGKTYFCNSTSMQLSKAVAATKANHFRHLKEMPFNENELEIIRLICEQYASKEIAGITHLAHRTIEKYRDRIMEKIGAKNVVGVVIYAIKNGIYKP
ncbi:response regulator transcription factor [Terrimonas pollutisoli]|uniref:response regulator transcription factor n=1 Tax=Terrimonas pollutisoli TaxID=3034147 RepID=UPI0023ED5E22|nr:response regulator transcription factor [Terrimonas sp. H1YJ31]